MTRKTENAKMGGGTYSVGDFRQCLPCEEGLYFLHGLEVVHNKRFLSARLIRELHDGHVLDKTAHLWDGEVLETNVEDICYRLVVLEGSHGVEIEGPRELLQSWVGHTCASKCECYHNLS